MTDTQLDIKTFDGEKIRVPKSDVITHMANHAISLGVRNPGVQALQTHMSHLVRFSDEVIIQMWDELKHKYQAALSSGNVAFGPTDEPLKDLQFDPLDLSKLPEMQAGHLVSIENDLGEMIEITRSSLEERIALRDADIQWSIIQQAFADEANPAMPADLIAVFQEGYTPPSKMREERLLQNWEEIKDGFYRGCKDFDLSESLSPDDPEYDRLTGPSSSPGVA
ncbi:hypothetical protein [Sulfitobacter sp. R18_1]|uniref:hypothetical protein n=1 Tax=Sulfitobacter sp. R18_1 TaxID=2821104 RepID=UPI001ADB25FB|nr:hypothetical protein [Sulfitobacter sp. R18_1]MBO9428005.1 hypothetical protein [Sulfitobacter sp. R18_1]